MIHLIVGNTGSGKTTYSNQLKRKIKGVVFSIDQWNNILYLADKNTTDGLEWYLERIERAEKMMMDLVKQLENADTDSILDLGLSKYEHREKFRKFATENGFEVKTHFLDIPKETRLNRVMKRNEEKGETFEFTVSRQDFDFMETWFEQPTQSEMKNGILVSELFV